MLCRFLIPFWASSLVWFNPRPHDVAGRAKLYYVDMLELVQNVYSRLTGLRKIPRKSFLVSCDRAHEGTKRSFYHKVLQKAALSRSVLCLVSFEQFTSPWRNGLS